MAPSSRAFPNEALEAASITLFVGTTVAKGSVLLVAEVMILSTVNSLTPAVPGWLQRQELAWIEGAALDRQRDQARVEVVRCAESDGGFRQETNGLGRGVQSRRHLARLDERRQARQPVQTGRRLCEAADRFDDAIEFESPEGAGVHVR